MNFNSIIIRNSLYYASEEMGIALRNSAYSPNIKERMDHSAAIFDSEGRLLAQAEHIPVHLGSLPVGLRNTLDFMQRESMEFRKGDMVVVNNPYIAGTHLNDVTLIRPVFFEDELVAFVANKAHHSDIGGRVPGSISMDAESIFEEGLIVNPVYLMRDNEFREDVISIFSANSRNPYERKGDLRAQAAANFTGERRILEILRKYGLMEFRNSSQDLFEYSLRLFLDGMKRFREGSYKGEDYIELDGEDIRLSVNIEIREGNVYVDYNGTSTQVRSPLNAVLGVTVSGVHYVFRTLLGENIPVNYGTFSRIHIQVPEGTVLNPTFPSPVAGGNVETSQRNADVIYLALSGAAPDIVPAASGGSMNNVMVGGVHSGRTWAFYETIGVGTGGRKGMDGIDGIHANMTNTMNTPIEEIEKNYPLMIVKYEFREGSSGMGEFRGGNGLIRAYRALDKMTFTILSDRMRHRPYGLLGGEYGAPTDIIIRKGKSKIKGRSKITVELMPGDYVEIRTAGGGGYGDKSRRSIERIMEDIENGLIKKGKVQR
ncbi:MAG: hydantoinase B/oxoprolinase family protein [Thermoplasmata archaeon]